MKVHELINTGEGVAIAIVPEGEYEEKDWTVYIVNTKSEAIKNVMVTSNGYGEIDNKKLQTSTLRWFFDNVPGKSYSLIEPILEEVFGLNNEYWVSYYLNDKMYDKRFVFLPETILESNMVTIPVINKKGILIK